MALVNEAQDLAEHYAAIVKKIRIIRKIGADDIIRPYKQIAIPEVPPTYPSREFEDFVGKYSQDIKEVRVIRRDGGVAQFFPAGTPESVVWASIVTKEEIEAE